MNHANDYDRNHAGPDLVDDERETLEELLEFRIEHIASRARVAADDVSIGHFYSRGSLRFRVGILRVVPGCERGRTEWVHGDGDTIDGATNEAIAGLSK